MTPQEQGRGAWEAYVDSAINIDGAGRRPESLARTVRTLARVLDDHERRLSALTGSACEQPEPEPEDRPDRELAVTVHETVAVAGWPHGTQRTEGDFYAAVYNAPCMHHELVRGLDHERRNGWRLIGQCDIDGVGDCLVFWRI